MCWVWPAPNGRVVGQYLVFMVVAGVIGCYGVIDRNTLLLVGAMPVSPDLLPITEIAFGVPGRDLNLLWRAFLTLFAGVAVAGIVASLFTVLQDQLDLLPADFILHDTV